MILSLLSIKLIFNKHPASMKLSLVLPCTPLLTRGRSFDNVKVCTIAGYLKIYTFDSYEHWAIFQYLISQNNKLAMFALSTDFIVDQNKRIKIWIYISTSCLVKFGFLIFFF